MIVIYVYGLLWLTSFLWIMYNTAIFTKHTNNMLNPAIWELYAFLSSFLLLGFFSMVRYGYKYVKWRIMMYFAVRTVKKIVRKVLKENNIDVKI